MDNFGFIRDKTDIKILILFILHRLPKPVPAETLNELAFCDDAINYFDYKDCLAELVKTGNVFELDGQRYLISDKGRRNLAELENQLPYTIRMKVSESSARTARQLLREAMISAVHKPREDGSYTVSLSLSDGLGSILTMDLLVGNEDICKRMEKHFSDKAEELYSKIVSLLLDE